MAEKLIVDQQTLIDSLKRVVPNYKKLGKDNFTVAKTNLRIQTVKELWKQCHQQHVNLLSILNKEELKKLPYFTEHTFVNAEEVRDQSLDFLHEVLCSLQPSPLNQVSDTSLNESLISRSPSIMPMPRIPLPTFSGNFTEWETFRDTFEALVKNNELISAVHRMHYLKASVTSDAAKIIANLKITDSSFESAWQLLLDEYDDPRAIINAHLQQFIDLPPMKLESAHELKHLRDTVNASLAALTNLKRPVNQWGDILVYVISKKFSVRTTYEWNMSLSATNKYPTYAQLNEFMQQRIRGLCDASNSEKNVKLAHKPQKYSHSSPNATVHNVASAKCCICNNFHSLYRCEVFKNKSVEQRASFARSNKLCLNCLKPGHFVHACPSTSRCRRCQQTHHTLLHLDKPKLIAPVNQSYTQNLPTTSLPENAGPSCTHAAASTHHLAALPATVPDTNPPLSSVLLATALVTIRTTEGRRFSIRALLDQGSTYSFITSSLADSLRTRRYKAQLNINGFGQQFSGSSKAKLHLTLECQSGKEFPITTYIFQKITAYAASHVSPLGNWPHLRDITLADPNPSSHQPIHLLIGADLYGSLLKTDLRQGPLCTPTAQSTHLGWIISSPAGDNHINTNNKANVLNCVQSDELTGLLQRFWDVEETQEKNCLSEEDEKCENHFIKTHSRTKSGRYVVRLPFKTNPPVDIGSSYERAVSLFKNQEKRLSSTQARLQQYNDFLSEYEILGHMQRADDAITPRFSPIYIYLTTQSCAKIVSPLKFV